MTEKFTFNNRLGKGGAVHFDKRFIRPIAVVVNGVSHQLLPRAALPADEDGSFTLGDLGDKVVHFLHNRGIAYNV